VTPQEGRTRAPAPRVVSVLVAGVVLAGAALVGCAGPQSVVPSSGSDEPGVSTGTGSGEARTAPKPAVTVPEARQGRPARSSRVRFEPESVTLPGGARAQVEPASTVDGELKVPEHVQHVGWWDGSSFAGDPFGSTVIAGHIDSATEGLGFFYRLRRVKVGEKVTLGGGGHRATYRIVSVRLVAKGALSSTSRAFDQTGDPRLVLITCGGGYHRDRGGYDSNLVVTGVPTGPVR
jgi:LPXTG-site transpeptidase (sortase) family protein